MKNNLDRPVIIAMDGMNANEVIRFASGINPKECRLKVGKELFVAAGPQIVTQLQKLGFDIFLDLKFHDIPNTVAQACKAAAQLGVWMVNVHALGGERMMTAAVDAISNYEIRPLMIGVTILTSLEQVDLEQVGINQPLNDMVEKLALLAEASGMDGIVCSPLDLPKLKYLAGSLFKVTPGVRLSKDSSDDQRRITTPKKAIECGADFLVIGRPITKANDPQLALQTILASLATTGSEA